MLRLNIMQEFKMEVTKYINVKIKGEDFDCDCEDCKFANCYNFRIHTQKLISMQNKYTEILTRNVSTATENYIHAQEKLKTATANLKNLGFKRYKSSR